MTKILLIDDENDVIEFYKSYLARRNYAVFTAASAKEAMEVITKESPDVVFCDIRLETDKAGLAILEETRKFNPGITVYLITGSLDREVEEKGISLGAREILIKPISNETLEEKIKESFQQIPSPVD